MPSFVEIDPPVPDKKIFEGVLPYMGLGGGGPILGIFIFLYLKAYKQNLIKNGPVVSEKSKFQFSYVNMTLGQGQEMTLILNTQILSLTQ